MSIPHISPVEKASLLRPLDFVRACISLQRLWCHRLRCRHELSLLTPAQMRDAGLDPIEVRREAAKRFWEA